MAPPSSAELQATAKQYDFVFLVDDSILVSQAVWDQVKEAVSSLADMVYSIASTKFTIRFVNNQQVLNNLRSKEDVLRDMGTVTRQGRNDFATVLDRLLDRKLTTYERLTIDELASEQKMIVIVVLGVSFSDRVKTQLDSVLTRAETRLDNNVIPKEYLGVQFLYFGRVPTLQSALQEIVEDHENISDYTQFTTAPSENLKWKILLGAVDLGVHEDDFKPDDPNNSAPPPYTQGATSTDPSAGLIFRHDPRVFGGFPSSQDLDINFNISSPFTIQFWLQPSGPTSRIVHGAVGTQDVFFLNHYAQDSSMPGSVYAYFASSSSDIRCVVASSNNKFPSSRWSLFTLVYPGNSRKYELYANGMPAASKDYYDGTFPSDWQPLNSSYMKLVYNGVNRGDWPGSGAVEQFQIYPRALTQNEMFYAAVKTAPK